MAEKSRLEANGLKLVELSSYAEPVSDIDRDRLKAVLRENFAGACYVVAWLDHKVLIGNWEDEAFQFYQDEQFEHKHIQRLRALDLQTELLVWRSNDSLKGRLRTGNLSGTGTTAIVAHQVLFGTTSQALNSHFTEISEKCGTRLILPFSNVKVDGKCSRASIKTHDYIGFNAVDHATYADCRFVAFTDAQTALS